MNDKDVVNNKNNIIDLGMTLIVGTEFFNFALFMMEQYNHYTYPFIYFTISSLMILFICIGITKLLQYLLSDNCNELKKGTKI